MIYAPTLKRHYKYKNIAAAMAVCLLLVLWLTTSCSNKALERNKPQSETNVVNSTPKKEKKEEKKITENYRFEEVDNKTVSNGDLVLVNADHKFGGNVSDTDTLYSYLFNSKDVQILYASTTILEADKRALNALNDMVSEYYSQTNDASLMVFSTMTTPDGDVPDIDEARTGLTFDLLSYDQSTGSYPAFSGEGTQAWIVQNSWKYGIILRYPEDKTEKTGVSGVQNHFRFIGTPHAQVMNEKGYCLEEYLEYLKKFSFEKPMEVIDYNGGTFKIYYVKEGSDRTTNIPVPQDADGKDYPYVVSGNNYDGFIVTVDMDPDTEPAPSETAAQTDDTQQTDEAADADTQEAE